MEFSSSKLTQSWGGDLFSVDEAGGPRYWVVLTLSSAVAFGVCNWTPVSEPDKSSYNLFSNDTGILLPCLGLGNVFLFLKRKV